MAIQRTAAQMQAANQVLARIDTAAGDIQKYAADWGLAPEAALEMVNHLDRQADALEKAVFGGDSFQKRQVKILKEAKVFQQDADEPYMKAFQVDQGVIQRDADEPYMNAYGDDQSSAVQTGKATNGRPLAP